MKIYMQASDAKLMIPSLGLLHRNDNDIQLESSLQLQVACQLALSSLEAKNIQVDGGPSGHFFLIDISFLPRYSVVLRSRTKYEVLRTTYTH